MPSNIGGLSICTWQYHLCKPSCGCRLCIARRSTWGAMIEVGLRRSNYVKPILSVLWSPVTGKLMEIATHLPDLYVILQLYACRKPSELRPCCAAYDFRLWYFFAALCCISLLPRQKYNKPLFDLAIKHSTSCLLG